ncbi:hypothetical protein Cgig2_030494 [Carnegiea gigantea]|uniref:Uncharacterized protein n=1 Tax=Carnegiea gigantea TaxID=171969 RepID=A0A9Q1GRI6_9CARY|nr:hypothetical protein Cgig2_030494 [Carnegiea gigantea]
MSKLTKRNHESGLGCRRTHGKRWRRRRYGSRRTSKAAGTEAAKGGGERVVYSPMMKVAETAGVEVMADCGRSTDDDPDGGGDEWTIVRERTEEQSTGNGGRGGKGCRSPGEEKESTGDGGTLGWPLLVALLGEDGIMLCILKLKEAVLKPSNSSPSSNYDKVEFITVGHNKGRILEAHRQEANIDQDKKESLGSEGASSLPSDNDKE